MRKSKTLEPEMNQQQHPKTSITIQTEYNTVTIEVPKDGLTIHEMMDEIIGPALLAVGYLESSVKEYIG